MEINDRLLSEFEGACEKCGNRSDCICEIDYATSPADRERLLQYLMGQGEMWKEFYMWSFDSDAFSYPLDDIYDWEFWQWLFLPRPDSDIPRWLFLLQEWLQLEDTRERFGVVNCKEGHPSCHAGLLPDCVPGTVINGVPQCTFKVKAEWARLVQDEKEG